MNQKSIGVFLLLIVVFPKFVYGHGGLEGANSGYNGFLHPLFVPAHILVILALGVLLGLQPQNYLKLTIVSFLASCALGLLLTLLGSNINLEPQLLVLSIVLGLLIAIDYKFSVGLYVFLAITTGLFLGLDSEHQDLSGKEKYLTLTGCLVGIWTCLSAVLIIAEKLNKKEWQKIALRIFGSWIATCAILVVSLLIFAKK